LYYNRNQRRKRGNDEADANAPPKVLRKDHAASRPTQSTLEGKSLASMGLEAGSTFSAPASQETSADTIFALFREFRSSKGATTAGDPDTEKSSSFTSMGLHNQTRNLETLLEAEVDMRKAAEAKNVELTKELESLRSQFTDLQVSNDLMTQQVSTLQAQVTGQERIKAAFEEFKKYEDDRVNFRCAKMDVTPRLGGNTRHNIMYIITTQ
ncbi:hypothetical protein Tco_0864503, partial [Tanacetum coccineum]